METKFKKSEFFNGKYEESFVDFLQLVDEELDIINFPSISYRVSAVPIEPLILHDKHHMITTPNRIAEEIAAILRNFEMWKKERSSIILWLYSLDQTKLHHLILTLEKDMITPRIYIGGGEGKYNNSIFWFWTYPFFYDHT